MHPLTLPPSLLPPPRPRPQRRARHHQLLRGRRRGRKGLADVFFVGVGAHGHGGVDTGTDGLASASPSRACVAGPCEGSRAAADDSAAGGGGRGRGHGVGVGVAGGRGGVVGVLRWNGAVALAADAVLLIMPAWSVGVAGLDSGACWAYLVSVPPTWAVWTRRTPPPVLPRRTSSTRPMPPPFTPTPPSAVRPPPQQRPPTSSRSPRSSSLYPVSPLRPHCHSPHPPAAPAPTTFLAGDAGRAHLLRLHLHVRAPGAATRREPGW